MKKTLPLLAALQLLIQPVFAQDELPFGLEWGLSEAQLSPILPIAEERSGEHFNVYRIDDLPRAVGDAVAHDLWVTAQHGLQRVAVRGQTMRKDPAGDKLRQRYRELQEVLRSRYGEALETYEYSGREEYGQPYEFNLCLEHEGCGRWESHYASEETRVVLRLRGLDRDSGYYRIVFEGPYWRDEWDTGPAAAPAGSAP